MMIGPVNITTGIRIAPGRAMMQFNDYTRGWKRLFGSTFLSQTRAPLDGLYEPVSGKN